MEGTDLKGLLPGTPGTYSAKSYLIGFVVAGLTACGTADVARAPSVTDTTHDVRLEAKSVDSPAIDARPIDDVLEATTHSALEPLQEETDDKPTAARIPLSANSVGQRETASLPVRRALSHWSANRDLVASGTPRRIGRRDATRGIFGFDEVRLGKSEVFRKWSTALQRHSTNRVSNTLLCAKGILSLCRSEDMVSDFDSGLLNVRQSSQHLPAVNQLVNRVSYVEDWANYRERDYWAAPGEFFGNGGDCEDYAIAKYLLLRELGVDPDSMRIVVVMDQFRDTAHAVLAIYAGNDIFILDNLSRVIEPHDLVDQYVPVYSLNENHAWLHTRPKTEIGLR